MKKESGDIGSAFSVATIVVSDAFSFEVHLRLRSVLLFDTRTSVRSTYFCASTHFSFSCDNSSKRILVGSAFSVATIACASVSLSGGDGMSCFRQTGSVYRLRVVPLRRVFLQIILRLHFSDRFDQARSARHPCAEKTLGSF